jgi:O-acetyl-ADP-ribose deacetylase (regulator of RNase III)
MEPPQKDSLVQALLSYFSKEFKRDLTSIPTADERRKCLHSIFVVRPPDPIPEEILSLQDQLLALELSERGVVDLSPSSKLSLWQGDITRLRVDAIVNAANNGLLGCFQPSHRCIDNVIHSNAGFRLRLACNEMMKREFPNGQWSEPTGHARMTPAFNLPCRFVVHTVGPIVSGKLTNEGRRLLRKCYESCLRVAGERGCRSIAFCCISTGLFGFPKGPAAEIAIATVREFVEGSESPIEKVIFNVFTNEDRDIYEKLLGVDKGAV